MNNGHEFWELVIGVERSSLKCPQAWGQTFIFGNSLYLVHNYVQSRLYKCLLNKYMNDAIFSSCPLPPFLNSKIRLGGVGGKTERALWFLNTESRGLFSLPTVFIYISDFVSWCLLPARKNEKSYIIAFLP